ncbi:hypothetical protein AVDCRST_MAG81-975 [uncultured Synechococcales cyanobacterium]|uniref:Uncharacterized protein n=1 Tax=uncultured Synechococcales cyanobacterium TaxID=1936017 RepID=A0A6J4V0I6_9CYAN|nr:hypothetical protein AVDCRST_MAG81-975 [uncultured Synechococcales cyanobacterium]
MSGEKPPTPNDILSGPYENNFTVRTCIDVWKRGECSWEQALMSAVLELARSQQEEKESMAESVATKHPDLMSDDELVQLVTDAE